MTDVNLNRILELGLGFDDRTTGFLEHFGVKGMRWGHRRSEKKLLKSEYRDRYKEALADEERKIASKVDHHLNSAKKLASQYDFDKDDGGGGSTKASRDAGKKYVDHFSSIDRLQLDAERNATRTAVKSMVDKYGEVKISQILSKRTMSE